MAKQDLPDGIITVADAYIATSKTGDRVHTVITPIIYEKTHNTINPQNIEEVKIKSFESFLHTITYDSMHLDPQKADGMLNPRELMEAAKKMNYHGDVFAENNVAVRIDPKFTKALKEYADNQHVDVKNCEDFDFSKDFSSSSIDLIFSKAPKNSKNSHLIR